MTFEEKQDFEILKIISKPENKDLTEPTYLSLVQHLAGHETTTQRIRRAGYIEQDYHRKITDLGRAALKELKNKKKSECIKYVLLLITFVASVASAIFGFFSLPKSSPSNTEQQPKELLLPEKIIDTTKMQAKACSTNLVVNPKESIVVDKKVTKIKGRK